MIVKEAKSDVQIFGNNTEFKTGIDPKNIDFIVTILSSNLYSDPENSFLRETVSNAWDAQVEAGTTDTPIIIKLSEKTKSITIRDYGTGLSPERVKEIYCNIGSSTKRESNSYIGMFGIGHLSALSCTDTMHVKSYYHGTEYYYLVIKSGNAITTNLVYSSPTQEKDGVEISIQEIKRLTPYYKALCNLIFFPNIYIDSDNSSYEVSNTVELINKRKVLKGKYFAAVNNTHLPNRILLGNVLYPLESQHFSLETQALIKRFENSNIVITFNIGELEITPNREAIIYNSETIKVIEDRIIEACKELDDLVYKAIPKDFNDIQKYNKYLQGYSPHYIPHSKAVGHNCIGYEINHIIKELTYKGKKLHKYLRFLDNILDTTPPGYRCSIHDGRFRNKNLYDGQYGRIDRSEYYILSSVDKITPMMKQYFLQKDTDLSFCNYTSKETWREEFEKKRPWEYGDHSFDDDIHFIVDEIYDWFYSRAINFDTERTDYEEFREENKPTKAKKTYGIKDPSLYVNDNYHTFYLKGFNTFEELIKYIKSIKKGIVLTPVKDISDSEVGLIQVCGYKPIKARKDIIKAILKEGITQVTTLEDFHKKDKKLPILKAVVTILWQDNTEKDYEALDRLLDSTVQEDFKKIYTISTMYQHVQRHLIALDIPKDPYWEEKAKLYIDHYHKYLYAQNMLNAQGLVSGNRVLTLAYIIKYKLYRVNYKSFKEVRNHPLFSKFYEKSH